MTSRSCAILPQIRGELRIIYRARNSPFGRFAQNHAVLVSEIVRKPSRARARYCSRKSAAVMAMYFVARPGSGVNRLRSVQNLQVCLLRLGEFVTRARRQRHDHRFFLLRNVIGDAVHSDRDRGGSGGNRRLPSRSTQSVVGTKARFAAQFICDRHGLDTGEALNGNVASPPSSPAGRHGYAG